MRVLLIDVNCKYSSTGKIVYDMFNDLNRNGHTARLCYGRGALVNEPNIYKLSSNIEVYAHAMLTRVTGLTGGFSPLATRNLIKLMDEFKPDVVHIHELHAYFVNIAPVMKYLKKNNIKTVWTFHCEFMYTGKCGHAYECEKWKTECGKCPQVKKYPSSLFFDFTNRMFNEKKKLFENFDNLTIVTPSRWLADRVKQSFLRNKDIRVIHNGIDTTSIFYQRPFEHLKRKHNINDEKIVLAVAPDLMSEQKGGRWVLELAKRFRNDRVKFILIGVDDLDDNFETNVITLGRTKNQHELAEYYSMADVFVICSKRENFPTTCLEAQCCGTPVCGFNTGGSRETSLDPRLGFVEYGDILNLAFEIKKILNSENGNIRKERSINAKNMYNNEHMAYEYKKLYLNIN